MLRWCFTSPLLVGALLCLAMVAPTAARPAPFTSCPTFPVNPFASCGLTDPKTYVCNATQLAISVDTIKQQPGMNFFFVGDVCEMQGGLYFAPGATISIRCNKLLTLMGDIQISVSGTNGTQPGQAGGAAGTIEIVAAILDRGSYRLALGANGGSGVAGAPGTPGTAGQPGTKGGTPGCAEPPRNYDATVGCGSDTCNPGGDGGNGGDGGPGTAGGNGGAGGHGGTIHVLTANMTASIIGTGGGSGGAPGIGGAGGPGGPGGPGGACSISHWVTEWNFSCKKYCNSCGEGCGYGQNGQPGKTGPAGALGAPGAHGIDGTSELETCTPAIL